MNDREKNARATVKYDGASTRIVTRLMSIPSLHLLPILRDNKKRDREGSTDLIVCHGEGHGEVPEWENADTLDIDETVDPTFCDLNVLCRSHKS